MPSAPKPPVPNAKGRHIQPLENEQKDKMINYRPHVAASTRIAEQIGSIRPWPKARTHPKPFHFDRIAYQAALEVLG